MKTTNSTTIELTVEVVTRSVVKVFVSTDEGVTLDRYGELGRAIFEATPAAVFADVERSFERVSFCNSSGDAEITATLADGKVSLSPCSKSVVVHLADSAKLDEIGHFVFHVGNDEKGMPVITTPVRPEAVTSVVAKVTPFTPEIQKSVSERICAAFLPGSLPASVDVVFQEFDESETKWLRSDESYAEVVLATNLRTSDYVISDWDEFSNFAYRMYGEVPHVLQAGDIHKAVERFMAERSVKTVITK
ncbi:TPA: hypothetical protein VDU83_002645 [Pseudomonas aeruginosa]|nr:hypothetical protein [Pseudomonas aeruginosa]